MRAQKCMTIFSKATNYGPDSRSNNELTMTIMKFVDGNYTARNARLGDDSGKCGTYSNRFCICIFDGDVEHHVTYYKVIPSNQKNLI